MGVLFLGRSYLVRVYLVYFGVLFYPPRARKNFSPSGSNGEKSTPKYVKYTHHAWLGVLWCTFHHSISCFGINFHCATRFDVPADLMV